MILTPKQLVVVRMRVRGRLGVCEIASASGMSHQAVSQILGRAKERLVAAGAMREPDGWDDMYELIEGLGGRGKRK